VTCYLAETGSAFNAARWGPYLPLRFLQIDGMTELDAWDRMRDAGWVVVLRRTFEKQIEQEGTE
jgi:hypothetical protein